MSADNKRVPSEEEVAAYKFFGKADNKMKAGMLKPAIRPPPSPTPVRVLTVSDAAGAKANSLQLGNSVAIFVPR